MEAKHKILARMLIAGQTYRRELLTPVEVLIQLQRIGIETYPRVGMNKFPPVLFQSQICLRCNSIAIRPREASNPDLFAAACIKCVHTVEPEFLFRKFAEVRWLGDRLNYIRQHELVCLDAAIMSLHIYRSEETSNGT